MSCRSSSICGRAKGFASRAPDPNGQATDLSDVYWDYQDLSLFFICAVLLGLLLRLGVCLHLLSPGDLKQPPLTLQVLVVVCLTLSLFAILKMRYRRPVWSALGWIRPPRRYVAAALAGGVLLAVTVAVVANSLNSPMPTIPLTDLALLAATLGPVLEESLFRGCLLPLVSRSCGAHSAVILTALLFAVFHQPPTVLHCACFAVSGAAYGWMRITSRSTAASAVMHAAYNVTLVLCWNVLGR